MALKKCKECGKKISTEASVCPNCGVPEPTKMDEKKKSLSKGDKFLLIFVLLPLLLLIYSSIFSSEGDSSKENKVTLSAEEQANQAREDIISKAFSAWDGSHIALTKIVKNSMNDPSSYEHVDTRYLDQGETLFVIMEFRGKNAFGGVVKNTVRARTNAVTGEVIEVVSQE